MKADKDFDLIEFVRRLEKDKISYMLIGRWAIILYGAPLMTADFDFWISPEDKMKVLSYLEAEEYEMPPEQEWEKAFITVYRGADKIDLMFFRQITNRELQRIRFDDCLMRSVLHEDRKSNFRVRVPSIDDLILLKKIERKSEQERIKDQVDIRILESLRSRRLSKKKNEIDS
jgi:hypothetical protein